MHTSYIIRPILLTVAVLLVPYSAMFFTNEVQWKAGDFLLMGGLLLGAGIISEYVLMKVQSPFIKGIMLLTILLVLLLLWVELAVGLFAIPGISGS